MKKGDDKDVFKEFQDSIKGMEGSLRILETSIPVEKQMEYFHYADRVRNNIQGNTVENQLEVLNNPNSSTKELKFALAYLAVACDVKAYRAIETFSENYTGDLSDWVTLALLQAKMTLESEFSEEKRIFISTGLGGKGSMIRFFSLFKSTNLTLFSDYQSNLIEKEIPFAIHHYKGIVERIEIEENYFILIFLIDIQVDVRKVLIDAINECNQYGDFIDNSFIITNVKIFNREEIKNELSNNG